MGNWTTDKVSLGYLPTYESIARELDDSNGWTGEPGTEKSILEVGVLGGAGMAMFADLVGTNRVYGVDLNPKLADNNPRFLDNVITCAQEDPGLPLVLQSNGWAPFHLIVDDCSHMAGPTAATLANLWPLVAPGGFYVIEDWNFFEAAGMAANLWQKIIAPFMAHPIIGDPPSSPPYSGMLSDVDSVTVRNGMIIIRRAAKHESATTCRSSP